MVADSPFWCMTLLTLSHGLTGFSCAMINQQEIAPNYIAIISTTISFVTSFSGFLSPMIVAYFIRENVRTFYTQILLLDFIEISFFLEYN